ncbi:MAG: sugar transferase [candidate division WOR-3 bacterium]
MKYISVMFLSDLLAVLISVVLAFLIKFRGNYMLELQRDRWIEGLLIVLSLMLIFVMKRLYIQRRLFFDELREILEGVFLAFLLIFAYFAFAKGDPDYSRIYTSLSLIFSVVFVPAFRAITKKLLRDFISEDVLVLKGPECEKVFNFLQKNWYLSYKPVGLVDIQDLDKWVGKVGNVVIPKIPFLSEFTTELAEISINFKRIFFSPDIGGIPFMNRIFHFDPSYNLPLVETYFIGLDPINSFLKRLFDIVFSATVLITLSPLLIIIAILIKLTSKGPVIYKHKRMGKNGKEFYLYKFRTMYENADKMLEDILKKDEKSRKLWESRRKLPNDPRITPIGRILRKFSLDELPQFFNVLKGDMSVVGPRPAPKDEIEKYHGKFSKYYFMVRPGITGLWQVSGRSDTDYEMRVKLDLIYILNQSFWLDIVIIFKTVIVVLKGEGAY